MRKAASRFLDAIDACVGTLAVFCLVAIAATTLAGVVSRYIFAASLTWTGEAGQWLFIYLIFLGVPLAHRGRLHVAIALFERILPRPLAAAHRVLIDAAVAYTTIALMFGAQELLDLLGGKSTALALPAWLEYAAVPASCALGLVYIALRDMDSNENHLLGAIGVALGAVAYAAFSGAAPLADPLTLLGVVFLGGIVLGMPIAFAMLLAVFLADQSAGVLPPPAIAQNIVRGSGSFLLLAIPLFLLAGALMDVGGLAKRLIDFAHTLVRHMRAGLAQVTIVAATLYGGVSGSSNANAALNARLMYPAMVKDGYKPSFAAAVCAAASMTDNIIPPSVGMLIVGAATGISVGQMFVAGIVPGLLFAGAMMLAVWAIARSRGYKSNAPRANWAERGRALRAAIPVIALAAFIVATLRLGVATPTETGAMAVAFAFAAGLWLNRGLAPAALWRALRQTALDSAMIGLLIGAATPFGFVLTTEHAPQAIVAFGETWLAQKWVMLMFLNVVLLLAGMVMDIGAAMLIFAPLFLPLATRFGVEPVHFALIVICNLMIGGLKPPFGILAFIVATIARLPVASVFLALIPFLIALLAALLLVTFIPALTMGLLWLGL